VKPFREPGEGSLETASTKDYSRRSAGVTITRGIPPTQEVFLVDEDAMSGGPTTRRGQSRHPSQSAAAPSRKYRLRTTAVLSVRGRAPNTIFFHPAKARDNPSPLVNPATCIRETRQRTYVSPAPSGLLAEMNRAAPHPRAARPPRSGPRARCISPAPDTVHRRG